MPAARITLPIGRDSAGRPMNPVRPRRGRRFLGLILLLELTLLAGCTATGSSSGISQAGNDPPPKASLPSAHLEREPQLRVRVQSGVSNVVVHAPAGLLVGLLGDDKQITKAQPMPGPLTISRRDGAFVLQCPGRPALAWRAASLMIQSRAAEPLQLGPARYPQSLVLHSVTLGSFDAINYVGIEAYLPGVLDDELYDKWEEQAYKAQAIAARSYAIYQMNQPVQRLRHYDLESTQASQAYAGVTTLDKALAAVKQSRGAVLTWQGKVLPAYYSSCTGGTGQDAVVAMKNAPDVPPLRGRNHGGWDAASNRYRWGPVVRERGELSRRIAAWGRASGHPVAALTSVAQISITARNSVGRPTQFTVADQRGGQYRLGPEDFRFACNYPGDSGKLAPSQMLYSSHVQVAVRGGQVHFTDGRGYGHGVGMSQWGAQGMAVKGYRAEQILAFYYPGARLEKAYR